MHDVRQHAVSIHPLHRDALGTRGDVPSDGVTVKAEYDLRWRRQVGVHQRETIDVCLDAGLPADLPREGVRQRFSFLHLAAPIRGAGCQGVA